MFRLANPNDTYPTKVTVRVPAADGWEEQEFTCHFRCPPVGEVRASMSNAEYLQTILRGWDGVEDHEGKKLPFTMENVRKIASIGYVVDAVGKAHRDRFDPEKNS